MGYQRKGHLLRAAILLPLAAGFLLGCGRSLSLDEFVAEPEDFSKAAIQLADVEEEAGQLSRASIGHKGGTYQQKRGCGECVDGIRVCGFHSSKSGYNWRGQFTCGSGEKRGDLLNWHYLKPRRR